MSEEKKLKTLTLVDVYEAPFVSLLRGHHSAEVFNAAFREEGWTDSEDPWPEDHISHEYWIEDSEGKWHCSHKGDPKAQPVTVAGWDEQTEPEIPPKETFH